MTTPKRALYTQKTLELEDPEFRISAIISDGMWYTVTKWRKLARVSEEELNAWIQKALSDGILIQSSGGESSYRFSLKSIYKWYAANNLELGEQLVDTLFPPRIWDNMSEVEGFLTAPLRELSVLSFEGDDDFALEVSNALRGVARVRRGDPGKFKCFCMDAPYAREIVEEVMRAKGMDPKGKTYARSFVRRREIVDFSKPFADGLVSFYSRFGKTLVRPRMDTIQLFIPDPEDQDSQVTLWVLTAIEKFDEGKPVPFSGYLDVVLKRWPYDLPALHLGKDLSKFQRSRSKAIKALKERLGTDVLSGDQIAGEMGVTAPEFSDLDDKHRVWTRTRNAGTLTWGEENADERMTYKADFLGGETDSQSDDSIALANSISIAAIDAGIETEKFIDAYRIIDRVNVNNVDQSEFSALDPEFVVAFGQRLGILNSNAVG